MQIFACVFISGQQGAACALYMTQKLMKINLHRKYHFLIYNWLQMFVIYSALTVFCGDYF